MLIHMISVSNLALQGATNIELIIEHVTLAERQLTNDCCEFCSTNMLIQDVIRNSALNSGSKTVLYMTLHKHL